MHHCTNQHAADLRLPKLDHMTQNWLCWLKRSVSVHVGAQGLSHGDNLNN